MKRILTALPIAMIAAAAIVAGCSQAQAITVIETPTFRYVHDWSEPKNPEGMVRIMQEMEARKAAQAEQEAAEAAIEAEAEYEGYEGDYGYYEAYSGSYSSYGNSFQSDGVAYIGDQEFTWYSQRAAPGGGLTELNANGRHVDESTGFVVDGDGYIAVASPWGQDAVGTVVETPYGQGKVYDVNEGDSYDIYTDF